MSTAQIMSRLGWATALFALPACAAAQPAQVFALVCRGTQASGSEAPNAPNPRRTEPWSGRFVIDLGRDTWRQDGHGEARPLLDWSVNGASLTAMDAKAKGFASSVRWVDGDAYYVGLGEPDLTVIRSTCTAEDLAGHPLPLPHRR